jgi:hypothetical protein
MAHPVTLYIKAVGEITLSLEFLSTNKTFIANIHITKQTV